MTDQGAAASGWEAAMAIEYDELTPARVRAHVDIDERHHQPFGIVHGGVHSSVVETLGSIGGQAWVMVRDETAYVVGVNNNTDFFRAVSEGAMTSVGIPLHQGRLQQLWLIETHSDADGRLISRGQVRLQNLYPETR